jgi:hypothetical protein
MSAVSREGHLIRGIPAKLDCLPRLKHSGAARYLSHSLLPSGKPDQYLYAITEEDRVSDSRGT